MRAPFKRLRRAEFGACRHEAGHLRLGDGDFLAAPIGKADVGDGVVVEMRDGGEVRFGHGALSGWKGVGGL